MHELSIAASVVEIARERSAAAGGRPRRIVLRIGRLAGVSVDALRFGFELLAEGTPLAGCVLDIEEVPVRVWCGDCNAEVEPPGVQRLACPRCGRPSGDIRGGRELDFESLELDDRESGRPGGGVRP
jgi:hydrogenase nickel incorporation protein HypA/HybF